MFSVASGLPKFKLINRYIHILFTCDIRRGSQKDGPDIT